MANDRGSKRKRQDRISGGPEAFPEQLRVYRNMNFKAALLRPDRNGAVTKLRGESRSYDQG